MAWKTGGTLAFLHSSLMRRIAQTSEVTQMTAASVVEFMPCVAGPQKSFTWRSMLDTICGLESGRKLFVRSRMYPMKRILILAALLAASCLASAQDVAGDWQGTLAAGAVQLRLVLHITKKPDGTLSATLDSVDQGANGIPVSSVVLDGSRLTLGVGAVKGSYEGMVSADGKKISGTWTQGAPLPPLRPKPNPKPNPSPPSPPTSTAPGWDRSTPGAPNCASSSTS
jgi:hypothetical protein